MATAKGIPGLVTLRKSPVVLAGMATIVAAAMINGAARSDDLEVASRQATQRTSFSDDEIKDGFRKIAFHAELQFDRQSERIRKFDEPVRVFIVDRGQPSRRAEVAAIVADIRARVDHLDLSVTDNPRNANFTVMLVPSDHVARTIRSRYGEGEAKRIQQALKPECLSGIGKDANFRIRRAEAILPADVDDFSFVDCAYEELLQGLGLINDDDSLPWTMFNDEVQMGFVDVYDQYLVNILYDPRVRPGMTKAQVEALLPDILPKVRAFVTNANTTKSER
jgi:hypothetical protein